MTKNKERMSYKNTIENCGTCLVFFPLSVCSREARREAPNVVSDRVGSAAPTWCHSV